MQKKVNTDHEVTYHTTGMKVCVSKFKVLISAKVANRASQCVYYIQLVFVYVYTHTIGVHIVQKVPRASIWSWYHTMYNVIKLWSLLCMCAASTWCHKLL